MGVRKKVEERRKIVANLYKNEKLNGVEIAIKLGVSKATISNDLQTLFAEGVIERRRKRTEKRKGRRTLAKEEIEERRKIVLELYNQKPSISYIANEMGLKYSTVYYDVKVLIGRKQIIIGETNESENKENESEESSEVQKIPEESTQLQNEQDENKPKKKTKEPEKLYTSMMIGKIMEFYKRGDIENAMQYLKVLQSEIEFTEEKNRGLLEIMEKLQKVRMGKQRKKQSSQEKEDEER